ncbi:MAG: hypothetical protein N2Z62_03410 [Rhodobacteraceae bacterium]|nr:hypothetical protein [Paracoccaceae bacterium]
MELALHIGAHRTATTSLQQALGMASAELAAAGTAFWGPEAMRLPGRRDHARNLRRAAADPAAREAAEAARREVARALAGLAGAGIGRLLVSEENLIGTMEGNFAAAALYPNAARNLAAAADLFGGPPAEVFLGLRDYAGWWASAYAQCVVLREMPPFDAGRIAASARGWPEVAEEVRATFPQARLTLWRHGPGAAEAALAAMLPAPLAGRVVLHGRRANAALSARGLRRFTARRRRAGGFDAAARRAAVAELGEAGGPPLRPFPAEAEAALAERFERDWARICRMPGVRVLAPQGEAVR